MSGTKEFAPGNYRFIPGPFQYSSGVAADPGYRIVRTTFDAPVPLAAGFEAIKRIITAAGRPLTAFCACELRSPGQFTDAGFIAFNKHYVGTLAEWGIFDGTSNPVARSNVCPQQGAPGEPSFHAFSYTEAAPIGAAPSFVIAGGAEARAGDAPYAERIVRYGEVGLEALREKATFVLDSMESRMAQFGATWRQATGVQVYCVDELQPHVASEVSRRGIGALAWHQCRPPVIGLEYEMDCRGVGEERRIASGG